MAVIQKEFNYMAFPQSFSRGNPIPLDKTSLWFSMEEMVNYSKTDPCSYVGQILTLVNETDGDVKIYAIIDTAGTLQEVGSATMGDDASIMLTNSTLALKNWGVQYYAWVEGEEQGTGEHVLQVVDDAHPWIAGLEPKVATGADGGLELAWYQPSTLTVEGVSSIVNTMQTTVNNLTNLIGTPDDTTESGTLYGDVNALEEAVSEKLPLAGGIMTGDLILSDGGKAASEKVVDTKIANAIGSAGHLKREIVAALPAVEDADPDTIYMIKSGLSIIGDKYSEYMLIDGAFEQIGDTSVDLSNYIEKVAGATQGNIAALATDGALVDSGIAAQEIADHMNDSLIHITNDERNAWNAAAEKATAMPEISQDNADKLAALPAITTIGGNLTLENGVLTAIVEIPVASSETLGGIKIGNGFEINDGVASVKVNAANANGLSVDNSGLAFGLATENTAGAMSAEQYVKLANIAANAQVNTVDGMLVGGEAAEIDENKMLVLPFATAEKPGVVKSSEADNGISVAVDGTMSVNRISTSKLFVPDGEELVLNGGTAVI